MWGIFKSKFGSSKEVDKEEEQPTPRDTLYVKKVGGGGNDYMVSHLALGGYEEYKRDSSNNCWTPDGVSSSGSATITAASSLISLPKNEYISTKGSDKDPVDDTITTSKCGDKYESSGMFNKALSELKKLSSANETEQKYLAFTSNLLYHIDIRFTHLMCLLKNNSVVSVVIAGVGGKHNLGSNLARGQWGLEKKNTDDYTDADKAIIKKTPNTFILADKYKETLNGKCYDIVIGLITSWCDHLRTTYPDRVTYGGIGIDEKGDKGMSNRNIHVWGANITNFNKSNDTGGDGQANYVRYKKATDPNTNAAGAFGIITTPAGRWDTDFKNEELIEESFTKSTAGGSKPRNRTRSKKRRNSRKSN
jgi:hypothetical protein